MTGTASARSRSGKSRRRDLRLFVPLGIAVAVVLASGWIAIASAAARLDDSGWVAHTWVVINSVDQLRLETARAEGDLLADALSDSRERAAETDSVASASLKTLAEIRALTVDNAVQTRRLDTLATALPLWVADVHEATLARGPDPVRAIFGRVMHQQLLREVDRLTSDASAEEFRLLAERNARVDASSRRLRISIYVCATLSVLVLVTLGIRTLIGVREQREAETAAASSEEMLEEFFDTTSDIIYTTGPDGKLEYTNRAWREALGYSKEEVKEMWLSQVIHPKDLEQSIALFHRIMAGEVMNNVDVDCITKDGRTISVMGSSHRRMKDGVPVGTNSISTDVTERRAEERRAAESHALVQAVLNSTSYLIVAIDTTGLITGLNPATAEALGTNEQLAVNHVRIEALFENAAFESIVAPADRTGRDDREYTLKRHDGSTFPAFVSVSELKNAKGERTGYAVVASDITARKEAELALLRATLEAEQASRAKGEFLANMSHEIRTPMNAVIGLTGLLLDTSLNDEQLEFVETIRSSGDSLLTIINDILDFSKIESGNLVLEAESFDVRDCVESALDLVAGRAAEKNVNLAYLVEDSLPQTLVGDITRVRQVLVNFLSNAVKFTERGDVYVHVMAHPLPDGRTEVAFSVRDTGIGIPSDKIDRLFRSFSQVDASTTRQFGGTGLGLAISKRLVELMGGDVSVASTPGEGSTFRFTINVAPGEVTRRTFLSGVAPELSNRRVLLVDDNATNRRILEQHMRGWGMHVVVATSGAEALKMIEHESSFDCAVFDMQMPGMDGEELATAWRAEQGAHVPPLILATSMGKRASAGEKLFHAVLSKPVKPSLLYDALISTFTGASQRRPRSVARQIDRGTAVRQPLRILLVEDNPVNQMVATRMCEKFGYRIDVAGNGLEALAAVNQIPYDTLLMDVHMPEMDGLEATRRIREVIPAERQPWIVAMTASAMESDRQACIAAGMDDHTPKPVTMESLEAALTRAWKAKAIKESV